MEITYETVGDYRLPRLTSREATTPRFVMFGRMRANHLMEHRRALYAHLLATGKLNAHLAEVDRQATEMMERTVSRMAKSEGVDEELKRADRMGWVGRMNGIRARAMEAVTRDLICS